MPATETILFVDDEIPILDSMRRQLRNRFTIDTAASGQEALEKCKSHGPFAVIVSDMRMPIMDGITLLSTIKDLYPDTVRLMLTGNADQDTASEAVNKGQIFRFLTKPCSLPVLVTSLALALRQHRLITAERELLDQTLSGSVRVLSELLSYTSPIAFGSSMRIRPIVVRIGKLMAIDNLWQLKIAALMSQIGSVTLPADLLAKRMAGKNLTDDEQALYERHPDIGADMLQRIPRMEGVARIIRNQLKPFSRYATGDASQDEEDLGASIIRAVFDYDLLLSGGSSHETVLHVMNQRPDEYNPVVLTYLAQCKPSIGFRSATLRVKDLTIGMITEEDVVAINGMLLVPKGQEITWPVLQGLINFSHQSGVSEPLRVRIREQATIEDD